MARLREQDIREYAREHDCLYAEAFSILEKQTVNLPLNMREYNIDKAVVGPNGKKGVWKTVSGGPIFIAEGDSLETAIKQREERKTGSDKREEKGKHGFADIKIGRKVTNIGGTEFKKPVTISRVDEENIWVKADDGKELGPFTRPLK